ncbi:MAG: hypothetical protein Q4E57_02345 [Eubacteriales bacterium]|nr:hypothetical protein [Eubacteriales bacterium]
MIEKIVNFLIAVFVNMAFRYQFIIVALVTFILHFVTDLPLAVTYITIAAWVIYSVLITLLITFVAHCNNVPRNQKGILLHPDRNKKFEEMYGKK